MNKLLFSSVIDRKSITLKGHNFSIMNFSKLRFRFSERAQKLYNICEFHKNRREDPILVKSNICTLVNLYFFSYQFFGVKT